MTRADDHRTFEETTDYHDRGRVPRRWGVVNGFLLVLLGLWGATVPLFGPYLGLGHGSDTPWMFTGDRVLLNFLPGLAVLVGGLGLIASARRAGGVFWGWLAALGGAWFIVGPEVSRLWNGGTPAPGEPIASSTAGQVFTELVFFSGLGALTVFLAAVALGRFTSGNRRAVVAEHEPAVPAQDRRDDRYDDTGRHDGHADEHRTHWWNRRGGRHTEDRVSAGRETR